MLKNFGNFKKIFLDEDYNEKSKLSKHNPNFPTIKFTIFLLQIHNFNHYKLSTKHNVHCISANNGSHFFHHVILKMK
jgi:hypothetical protein